MDSGGSCPIHTDECVLIWSQKLLFACHEAADILCR